jgi:hypothetical protein
VHNRQDRIRRIKKGGKTSGRQTGKKEREWDILDCTWLQEEQMLPFAQPIEHHCQQLLELMLRLLLLVLLLPFCLLM